MVSVPIDAIPILSEVGSQIGGHKTSIEKAVFEGIIKTLLEIGRIAIKKKCRILLTKGGASIVLEPGGERQLRIFRIGVCNWDFPVKIADEASLRTFFTQYGEGSNYNYLELAEEILQKPTEISVHLIEK